MLLNCFATAALFAASIIVSQQHSATSNPFLEAPLWAGKDQHCEKRVLDWTLNSSFVQIKNELLTYENELEETCNATSDFFVFGKFYLFYPSVCQSVTLCNATYCLRFEEKAMKFIYTIPRSCVADNYISDKDNFYINLSNHSLGFLNLSKYHTIGIFGDDESKPFQAEKEKIGFDSCFADDVDKVLKRDCQIAGNLYLKGLPLLPQQCSDLRFCNNELCYVFTRVAFTFAKFKKIQEEPNDTNLLLPTNCKPAVRFKRSIVSFLTSNENSTAHRNVSLLNFNLPGGYKYCGPGTDIERMDDDGGPINKLDELCRNHDVDYLTGVPTVDADSKLLEGMWNLRHPYLPFFVAIFEAKRFYELIAGTEYTSSLYYFPEESKSLTYILWRKSVYDKRNKSLSDTKTGNDLEQRWQKQLHNIWLGYCYAPKTSAPTQMANDKNPGASNPPNQEQSCSTSTGQCSRMVSGNSPSPGGSRLPDRIEDTIEDMYPVVPRMYGTCRLVISEFGVKSGRIPSFIELQKICPSTSKSVAKALTGFQILIVRIGDPSSIYMSYSMEGKVLRQVSEKNLITKRDRTNYYYVIGSDEVLPDTKFNEIRHMITPFDGIRGVPGDSTFAIILLHYPDVRTAAVAGPKLWLKRANDVYFETHIDDEKRETIKKYLQDIIIYGEPCAIEICEEFRSMIPTRDDVQPVNNMIIPIPYAEQTSIPPFKSINRCVNNLLPMQLNDFVEGDASPGTKNNCPAIATSQRFNLKGFPLQHTAQKLIVNSHQFFLKYSTNPVILNDDAVTLTSTSCSISETTVRKVLENWRKGEIVTPGKKRNYQMHSKFSQLDSFQVDLIKRIITDFYERKKAPMVADIYKKFKQQVSENEALRREIGETVNPFTCSEKTFRIILHKLGYKYGKINMRDALLMRPDLVIWRGKYLKEIRKNRSSQSPMKLIYLDETWIDPHARTGKAWVPKKCTNYRERAKYTFKTNKVSRGPRIIVLNAGGADGMFHQAMEVFPVQKNKVKSDYHDNIDAKAYIRWFKNLLNEINKTGNKYIIIQDNAPYHGSSDVPQQKDKKEKMYDWLKDNLPLVPERMSLEPIENYRKYELWQFVKQQKSSKNFYVIDRLAEENGHRVLRLPPYNCDLNPIELVWRDVKHAVKKDNTDQTVQSVTELAKKIMLEYPVEKWKSHMRRVERLEEEYWTSDGFYDTFMDNEGSFIIPIDENEDENDDEINVVPVDPDVVTSVIHDDVTASDDDFELPDI